MTVALNVKYEGAMKRISFVFGAAMAAIFALTSCNKEISNPDEIIKDGVPFEISAASADTKTSNSGLSTNWVAGDALNLFHAEAGSNIYISDGSFSIAEEDLESKKFKGTLTSALGEGNYDWYAIYPYNKYVSTPANTGNTGYVTVGGKSQTQEGNSSMAHLCRYVCPLYGVAKSVESNSTPGITMNHLTSIIEVNVTNNSGKDLTVTSVSFTGTENIVGTYYIDFTQTPVVYTSRGETYVSNMASLSVTGGEAIKVGASAKFYIAIKPFTATSGNTLTVSVNGYEKVINLTKDVTFTAGLIKTINFKYDKIYVPQVYALVETDGAFVNNGKYILALKDGKNGTYYFINNAGSSNNLSKSQFTVVDGKITDPDLSYVFTAKSVSGGFTLSNINGKYICNSSSTTINTNSDYYTTWVPTFLDKSMCYKISNGSNTGRYISYATKETEIKAYLNDSFKDQIDGNLNVCQYAGAISLFSLYDPTAPKLLVTPTSKTWASDEIDAAVFKVTTNTEGKKDWSVSPETLDWATIAIDKAAGTITVTPNGANTTETAREATLTVSHSAGTLSETITLTQKGVGVAAPASITIDSSTKNFPSSYGSANEFSEYTLNGLKYMIQQVYVNGAKLQWRASGNYSGTGTMYNSEEMPAGIASIVITFNTSDSNKNHTVKIGNSANPTSATSITPTKNSNTYTYTCDGSSKYFVITNGTGAGYIDSIVINFN